MSGAEFSFDPRELVRAVDPDGERIGALPLSVHVASLLGMLFRSSLRREEGVSVRCAVALCRPTRARVVELPPSPISVDWLRKVGTAFAPEDLVIAAAPMNDLPIHGLLDRQAVDIFTSRGDMPTAVECVAECRGTAEVALRAMGRLAVYRGERVHGPGVSAVNPARLPLALGNDLASVGQDEGVRLAANWTQRDPNHMRWRVLADSLSARMSGWLAEAIRALAERVRRIGKGGSFWVLPSGSQSVLEQLAPSRDRFMPPGAVALADPWDYASRYLLGFHSIVPSARLPYDATLLEPYISEMSTIKRMYETTLDRVARMTRVDGAVVIAPTLYPIAVGAKLQRIEDERLPATIREWLHVRHLGLRHRSTAAAIAQIPGSAGVVVSQDGDATVFVHGADGLDAPIELAV